MVAIRPERVRSTSANPGESIGERPHVEGRYYAVFGRYSAVWPGRGRAPLPSRQRLATKTERESAPSIGWGEGGAS